MRPTASQPAAGIALQIVVVRGMRVLLDTDLATLYGVATKRFNEQVRRNRTRFPPDFMFQLTAAESESLRSQNATLKARRGQHRKYLPYAFSEHGAIMAATILNTSRAVEMSVYVVRAFITLRAVLASNKDLARKLAEIERSLLTLDAETQRQFKEVYAAIRALTSPAPRKRRSIGFTADIDV